MLYTINKPLNLTDRGDSKWIEDSRDKDTEGKDFVSKEIAEELLEALKLTLSYLPELLPYLREPIDKAITNTEK